MTGSSLVLSTSIFFSIIWAVSRTFKAIELSPLPGEILAGYLLGPKNLDFVPFTQEDTESLLSVLGNIGVNLIIVESGLHVNLKKLRLIGVKALLIGILGTIIPIGLGMLVLWLLDFNVYPEAFTSAIILTPASVSVAIRTLISTNTLNSTFGQAIVMAAYVDDFLAIIAFIVIKNLNNGTIKFMTVGFPILMCLIFIVVGLLLAAYVYPIIIPKFLKLFEHNRSRSFELRDEIHICIMFFVIGIYYYVGDLIGSSLLGSFLAGVSFFKVRRSMLLWRMYIKMILSWLVRLFFSATIAFLIPGSSMIKLEIILKGLIVGVVCIVSKLLATLHMGKDKFIIGWALVSRGEFSFLVAEFAIEKNIIDDNQLSILVWGLLLSTFISPIVLKCLINRRKKNTKLDEHIHQGSYLMTVTGNHHQDLLEEVTRVLHDIGFDIETITVNSDGDHDQELIKVKPRNRETEIDVNNIKKEILEAVNDDNMILTFVPVTENRKQLKIQIIGKNIYQLKNQIYTTLSNQELIIERATKLLRNENQNYTIFVKTNNTDNNYRGILKNVLEDLFRNNNIPAEILVCFNDGVTPIESVRGIGMTAL